ncbi:MAG: hypothetical protein WCA64_03420 [Gallionella sp.]
MDMTFAGIGLHVFIAVFFAIHVVRTGQPMYWLIILFIFPLLGSIVYFFAVYLPGFRLNHRARRVVAAASRALDPQREIREARAAFEQLPTAQNQIRLAEAQLELGLSDEAAKNYEACLNGPFLGSLEIRFGAARAFVECKRYREAIEHLESIQNIDLAFRREAVSLLLARSYAGVGRNAAARAGFESVLARYGSFQARAEYAIWALSIADAETTARILAEIGQITKRWSPQARELNAAIMQRLNDALAASGKHL